MKKKNIFVLIIFSLIFSLINFNNIPNSVGNQSLPNNIQLPQLNDHYNATSSEDYFNETSYPRYHLAARPFGMIQYPNKANPSISVYGETIKLQVSSSSETTNWNFTLIDSNDSLSLDIVSSDFNEGIWQFNTLPEYQRKGLYDLQLNCSEGDDYQTHAIQILEEKHYPFTFVQISDTHFPAYYEEFNTSDINLQTIEEIKALNPDFIIHTGDLIQGPTAYFLDPETQKPLRSEIQYRLGIWALDLLDKPVFYIYGNHEFIQSTMIPDDPKENYYKYFGYTVYQNFTYLDWTFVGYGSEWDGLTQEDYDTVSQILSQNSDGATVLYYHYDFAGHSTSLLNKFPIELALYGHLHVEDLYLSKNTLYHVQAPLFEGAYTLFTILNETSLNVNSQVFNFELLPYVPPTTTMKTMSFGPIIMIVGLMVYYLIKKR